MVSASGVELAAAGVVLVGAVGAGTLAHELSHALALRLWGVRWTLEVRPDDEAGALGGGVPGRWATVRPTRGRDRLTPRRLRVAAAMPLCLLAPFALVPLGVAPDPMAVGNPLVTAAVIGWTACAIPSPRDFALVWHPERALARRSDAGTAPDRS